MKRLKKFENFQMIPGQEKDYDLKPDQRSGLDPAVEKKLMKFIEIMGKMSPEELDKFFLAVSQNKEKDRKLQRFFQNIKNAAAVNQLLDISPN